MRRVINPRIMASLIVLVMGGLLAASGEAAEPRVVATVPEIGAKEVDPEIKEIRVTFDRDMEVGMSWTGEGEAFPKIPKDQKPKWVDARTCALPVKLEAGKFYRVGINSTGFQNFKSAQGEPARPKVIYFTTKGASEEIVARLQKPAVVSLSPASGSDDVSAATTELVVRFDAPMSPGMSWVGAGEYFPETTEGAEPQWSEDGMTCTFPVILKPGREYRMSLNGIMYINFQSAWGVPLDPVDYQFKTSP